MSYNKRPVRFVTPGVENFNALYGNYENGHNGNPRIEGIGLGTDQAGMPQVTYYVSYTSATRPMPRAGLYSMAITSAMVNVMREWLLREPITKDNPHLHLEGEVFRRIEQYYGEDGLEQFVSAWHRYDLDLELEHRHEHEG